MFESTISFFKRYENRHKIEKDFEWLLKIVMSCENFNHIVVSNRVFDNFLYKWRHHLNEKDISDFSIIYERQKSCSVGKFL